MHISTPATAASAGDCAVILRIRRKIPIKANYFISAMDASAGGGAILLDLGWGVPPKNEVWI